MSPIFQITILVVLTGFEPVTLCSSGRRSTNELQYNVVEPNEIESFPMDFQSTVRTSYTKVPLK